MLKIPSLEELLKAGVHFGHQKSKWHPKMAPFIFTEKNKVHIINLEKTQQQLEIAINYIKDVVSRGGTILFLGTKKQAKGYVKEAAIRCGMPYMTERWLGGTFTNARSVLGLVRSYKRMKTERDNGTWERFTKRERLKFQRKLEKLEPIIGGLEHMSKVPDAVFIVDVKTEKTAVLEANTMKVPIVAMCDTNVNPSRIQYVIPANDDAVKSIELIVNLMADAVLEAKTTKKVSADKAVAPQAAEKKQVNK